MIDKTIVAHPVTDCKGYVRGGNVRGVGLSIDWQPHALQGGDPEGVFVEDVIEVVINRLKSYQNCTSSCGENALAITKLQEATLWLYSRRARRKKAGIEGTDQS